MSDEEMTLESVIKHCEEIAEVNARQYKNCPVIYDTNSNEEHLTAGECAEEYRHIVEWLKDYKRLKEQEPCEDCISRQAAQAKLKSICDNYNIGYEDGDRLGSSAYAFGHAFDDLPPVTPHYTNAEIQKIQEMEQAEIQKAYELGKAEQSKIGRWIEDAKTYYEELKKRGLVVDEYTPYFTDDNETQFFKHCPNCGAKM